MPHLTQPKHFFVSFPMKYPSILSTFFLFSFTSFIPLVHPEKHLPSILPLNLVPNMKQTELMSNWDRITQQKLPHPDKHLEINLEILLLSSPFPPVTTFFPMLLAFHQERHPPSILPLNLVPNLTQAELTSNWNGITREWLPHPDKRFEINSETRACIPMPLVFGSLKADAESW